MDDLFKDLVFLGGTPLDSIARIKRILHDGVVLEYSLGPSRILHNGAVRVFVRIMHGLTQSIVRVSLMYSST